MLKKLTIQNYALIQELNIDFSNGLSIITGETGAGKSILLGALSLIVGQRADSSVLLDNTRKCIVEGTFILREYGLEDLFKQHDLDFDNTSVIRREISPDGKSRAFVNDTPVNLSVLKDLGEHLIDIHSQHQNIYLETLSFQLRILDTFARQNGRLQKYREVYNTYKNLQSQYQRIFDESQKNKADLDYFKFQYDQLHQANLKEDEQESLEQEIKVLTHSEEIKTALSTASTLISGESNSIIFLLKDAFIQLNKIKNIYQPSANLSERIDSILIEMKDIAGETEHLSEHIEHDPQRAEFVKQRIDLLYSLLQKHRATSIRELIAIKDDLKKKVDEVSNAEFHLDSLKKEMNLVLVELESITKEISTNRKNVIPMIEDSVQFVLKQLGMPNGIFNVEITPLEDFTSSGKDKIKFLFSANKQGVVQELSKVASGGEMSRLMLSLKSIISDAMTLPTIIFDEIDAGVSGDIADKMGNVIFNMSKNTQVINITHLPQIASKGVNHYLVYKHDQTDKTQTLIKQLKPDERIIEIARMLSGEQLSEAAINNAKTLLGIN
jgi:DNA repair protein RecN (Recombination protein N)